jgi:hypothetical protein
VKRSTPGKRRPLMSTPEGSQKARELSRLIGAFAVGGGARASGNMRQLSSNSTLSPGGRCFVTAENAGDLKLQNLATTAMLVHIARVPPPHRLVAESLSRSIA